MGGLGMVLSTEIRIFGNVSEAVTEIVEECVPDKVDEEFDTKSLEERQLAAFNLPLSAIGLSPEMKTQEEIGTRIYGIVVSHYEEREQANTPEVKIITTEDPVEYDLDGIIQVPIKEEIGVTYAACLRSILRQDPDKILVGE